MSTLNLNRQHFGNAANQNNVLSRNEAEQLLNDWVKNERLKLHMKQVAYLMATWAKQKEEADEHTMSAHSLLIALVLEKVEELCDKQTMMINQNI